MKILTSRKDIFNILTLFKHELTILVAGSIWCELSVTEEELKVITDNNFNYTVL